MAKCQEHWFQMAYYFLFLSIFILFWCPWCLQKSPHLYFFLLKEPLCLECPHHWSLLRRDMVVYGGNMTTAEKYGVKVQWLRWTELIREQRKKGRMWVRGQREPREWVSGYSKRQCSLSIHTHTHTISISDKFPTVNFLNRSYFLRNRLWGWLMRYQLKSPDQTVPAWLQMTTAHC